MLKKIIYISSLVIFSVQANAACNIVNGKTYGDCSHILSSENENTNSSERSEYGIINGAQVNSKESLNLYGISNGDIIIREGGTLIVFGVVNGKVQNNGGVVNIFGQVSHMDAISGETTIHGTVSKVSGSSKIIYIKGSVVEGVEN